MGLSKAFTENAGTNIDYLDNDADRAPSQNVDTALGQ